MNKENKREVEGNKEKKGKEGGGKGHSEEHGVSILHCLHIFNFQYFSNMWSFSLTRI
jgi:hypothetical protein